MNKPINLELLDKIIEDSGIIEDIKKFYESIGLGKYYTPKKKELMVIKELK